MSHTIFTAMVEKKYKQAYKQHFDKLFPLYQSKQIELEGVNYHVVCKMRMRDYTLFSVFEILDEMVVILVDTIYGRVMTVHNVLLYCTLMIISSLILV